MTDPDAPAATAARAMAAALLRSGLIAAGTGLAAHGYVDQETVNGAASPLADYLVGAGMVVGSAAWAAVRARAAHWWHVEAQRLAAGRVAAPKPFPLPQSTNGERPMSIASTLKHVLGFVAGILIPGTSPATTNLTHEIQQHFADLYGDLARDMAVQLKTDTTGMSGPDKVFAITKALVATAQRDGFKGDVKVLGTALLDVAQSAFRASEPDLESEMVALASSLSSNPIVKLAETLVIAGVSQITGKVMNQAA